MKDRTYFTLSKQDRYLHLCGVPLNWIKKPVSAGQLNFNITSYSSVDSSNKKVNTVITPAIQQQCLINLLSSIGTVGESVLYCIGSYPTDQPAFQMAAIISKTYARYIFKNNAIPKIKWIDLGRPDWDFLKSDEEVSLLIVHGITQQTTDVRRLEIAKDFLNRCEHATRILLTTSNNVLTYLIYTMGLRPDAVWQLGNSVNRVIT